MTYEQAIHYIETKTWSTTRLGLGRTRELLRRLGDPQKQLKFVHVAGSNGKGSTCAMIASVLQQAGYKTGLYTSPHLMSFCERFQINGEWISEDALARVTEIVKGPAEEMEDHPSQFEISTALAMVYFLQESCDIVVMEVGMGGELDSTNVIDAPEAAVIMNIGLEHTEYLGDTLEKIARTKGGILKTGCDAILYPNVPEVEHTIETLCKEREIPLHKVRGNDLQILAQSLFGQRFIWKGEEYRIPLSGEHQCKNAAVALETIDVLQNRGWEISEVDIEEGLRRTSWPARMEVLCEDPLFILDGGHNPQCIEALAENVRALFPGQKVAYLLGILGDKDYRLMLEILKDTAAQAVCVAPNSERALSAEELTKVAEEILQSPAVAAQSIEKGLELLLSSDCVPKIAVGSLYMAGELRERFPSVLKRVLRKQGIAARDALSREVVRENSHKISQQILNSEEYKTAHVIFSYRAIRAEVDLREVHEQAVKDGKVMLYPLCVDGEHMQALRPESDDAYRKGAFGIEEPDPDHSQVFDPKQIDLVLCPCTVFDEQGGRIGMGAGYYDRFLRQCENASIFAVAHEAQKKSKVPMDPQDHFMNAVITEKTRY